MQSKISHIFAGVPVPKKKSPMTESPQEQSKEEIVDITQLSQDEVVIDEPEILDNVAEQEISNSGTEEKQIQDNEPEIPEAQEIEEELPDEQSSVINETNFETEAPEHAEPAQTKKQKEEEILKELRKADKPLGEAFIEYLMKPHVSDSKHSSEESQVQKSEKQKPKVEKPVVEKNIPAPPVKKPVVEKPPQSSNQKIEIGGTRDITDFQKQPVGKIPSVEAVKKRDLQLSRKISSKSTRKRLKTKARAEQPRQKIMIVLSIVLMIVLILLLGRQYGLFSSGPEDGSGTIEQPAPGSATNKNTENIKIDWPVPPLYPDNLSDPMGAPAPPPSLISQTDKFIVSGISNVNGEYLVLIGTENYKLDEKIKDYDAKIINITKNNVEFQSSDGKTWTQAVGE